MFLTVCVAMTRYLVKPEYTYACQRRVISSCVCVMNLLSYFQKCLLRGQTHFQKNEFIRGKKLKLHSLLSIFFPYTSTKNVILQLFK